MTGSTPWPRRQGQFPVGQDHWMHWREYGAADGIPVVCLHGGPGSAFNSAAVSLFDTTRWRIIAYDQRGCGASQPIGALHDNTTAHLVADLERLRKQLDIRRWVVFGGSWGAALALCYAQSVPQRVSQLVLRGTFPARPADLAWFTDPDGAGCRFPAAYRAFTQGFSRSERGRLVDAFWERLHGDEPSAAFRAVEQWMQWEAHLVTHPQCDTDVSCARVDRRALARVAVALHYARNRYFLGDGGAFASLPAMAHVSGVIVHGEEDAICPLAGAMELHRAWPCSRLDVVKGAGHSANAAAMRTTLQALFLKLSLEIGNSGSDQDRQYSSPVHAFHC